LIGIVKFKEKENRFINKLFYKFDNTRKLTTNLALMHH